MDDYFEAIAWGMARGSAPRRSINMKELGELIRTYNNVVRAGKGATALAVSRASLYRKFTSADDAMARTRSYLVSRQRTVPAALESYVLTIKESTGDPHARVWNTDSSIDVLERALERSRASGDDVEQVILSQYLAEKLLREAGRSDEQLNKAYEVAQSGYKIAESSPTRSRSRRRRHEQLLCARAAARAGGGRGPVVKA